MKEKDRKKKWEERLPLAASFLLPLLLVVIVCISHEVYPFGDQCILHIDMYHQYCPFFTELLHKLREGGSAFYTWNVGLGVDFVSLYAYYLASPLNWLLIFCPQGAVIEFMTILVVLKISLAGLFFGYYLKYHFSSNHPAISIFATAYALSAFVAAYAWNIMWMDCIALAPLVLVGLEKLVKEEKTALYYVSLSLCILSNYYISIMICIFLVIWFLVTFLQNRESGIKAWIRFFVYSLIAGGTGAVLIIPEAIILGSSGSKNISFPDQMEWYFNLIAELGRHSAMTDVYTGRNHWPNIYCGVFTVMLFVLFFLNREFSWKKKCVGGVLALFFLLSFANNQLDFIWHGLHFPDSLPGRQSFLYLFLLLVLSYETFLHFKGNRLWHALVAGAVPAAVFLWSYQISEEDLISTEAKSTTLVFLVIYTVILCFYFWDGARVKTLMLQIACFAMVAELLMNFNQTGLGTTGRTPYVQSWSDYQDVLSDVKELTKDEGVTFYRTEELERKTKNDAALFGYHSATQFSSLMNLDISHFYQAVGMEGGKNFYCINGATPLLSAMLSLRYVIADNGEEANPIRTLVAQSGSTYLYENKYVLPLGFMMSEDVVDAWNYKGAEDKVEAQNELAYLLGAKEPMLTEIPAASENGVSTIEVSEDAYIFATYGKTTVENLTEEISDGRTKSFSKVSHGYTLDLGYCNAGDTIQIKNTINQTLSLKAYKLNLEVLADAYDTLQQQTMELTSFSDTKITGKVNVKEAGRMILSIANDNGWTLYVDGVKTQPQIFGEGFISVSLDEGEHEICLKYETPGFRMGLGISLISIAVFAILMYAKSRRSF